MYNEQNNNYNAGGNYSSNYQGYHSGEGNGYSYYEVPRPKKKNTLGKAAVIVLTAGVVVGGSALGGFCIGSRKQAAVSQTSIAESVAQGNQEAVQETAEPAATANILQAAGEDDTYTPQTVTAVVTDVTDVVEKVMPSVVSITNTAVVTQSFWGQEFQSEEQSSGSGIIVGKNDTELLVVTNNHVISDSTELKVQFIDSSVADAKVKGTDSNMDLAVIAVPLENMEEDTMSNISIAALGDSESLKVGEPAIAIGNALGYGQSVTTGVISALNRQIEMSEDGSTSGTLIQTDAAINPGNSGGALLNVKGEVIGINSNKIGGTTIEGMGYAIPISNARPIIEELMNRETKDKVDESRKGYLAISGLNVTSDVSTMYGMPEGVYVAQVYEGGAAQAGMLKGDIITAFDGSSVKTMQDLQEYLEYYEIGENVLVTVQRPAAGGYVEHTLLVVLGAQAQTP